MAGCIPSIVLEDVRPPPPKRRRLNKCLADSSTDEDTVFNVQDQFLATTDPLSFNNKASEGNSADTIVCFGMVSVGSYMALYSYLEDIDCRPTRNYICRQRCRPFPRPGSSRLSTSSDTAS